MKQKGRVIITVSGALFLVLALAYIVIINILYKGWLWKGDGRYIIALVTTPLVLGILVFILLNFLFFNKKYALLAKKQLVLTLTITPLLLSIALFSARLLLRKNYQANHIFTTERWLNTPTDDRWHLMYSFNKQHNIIGKNYDDIYALLGEPDEKTTTYCRYYLGFGRGLINIDQLYYFISFDENMVVTTSGVYQS